MDALFDGERLSMSAVARTLKVHVATVWRWRLHGIRGQKLRTVLIGGRRFVMAADLQDFLRSGNISRKGSTCMDSQVGGSKSQDRPRKSSAARQVDRSQIFPCRDRSMRESKARRSPAKT